MRAGPHIGAHLRQVEQQMRGLEALLLPLLFVDLILEFLFEVEEAPQHYSVL